jgi:hypothetical protein
MLRSKVLPQASVWDRLTFNDAWSDGQSGVIITAGIVFIFLALVRSTLEPFAPLLICARFPPDRCRSLIFSDSTGTMLTMLT